MTKRGMSESDSLTAARLAAAVTLATSIQAEGFDELLDRFREAYEAVVDVSSRDDDEDAELLVRLPHVDAPEIPEPPAPRPPVFERNRGT